MEVTLTAANAVVAAGTTGAPVYVKGPDDGSAMVPALATVASVARMTCVAQVIGDDAACKAVSTTLDSEATCQAVGIKNADFSQSGNILAGSTLLLTAANANIAAGQAVSAASGLAAGTTVSSVGASSSFTVAVNGLHTAAGGATTTIATIVFPTGMAAFAGMTVTGTGIDGGTTVATSSTGTSVSLSKAITGDLADGTTLTFGYTNHVVLSAAATGAGVAATFTYVYPDAEKYTCVYTSIASNPVVTMSAPAGATAAGKAFTFRCVAWGLGV